MTTLTQESNKPKWQVYATYGLMGLLTLAFVAAGGSKLAGAEMHVQSFTNWGYPLWFMYITGLVEVGSIILMWLPKTRLYGALGLVVTMLGAIATHIQAGEFAMLPAPVVLFVLAGIVAWLHRPQATV